MAPLSNVLTVALLILGGVDAKRKDKVAYSRYIAGDCNGHPLSGDIDALQLRGETSECTHMAGQGVRFHKHKKDKYSKWIDNVNSGRDECGVTLYRASGCISENVVGQVSLPAVFNECNPLHASAGSIQFWCRPNHGYHGIAQVQEIELPVTSYSIDKYGKAHPSVYTTAINVTQKIYNPRDDFTGIDQVTVTVTKVGESPINVNATTHVETTTTVATPKVAARAEPTPKAALEPRKKQYNVKGVWMKHPWASSDICFKCWTKKEEDFDKFKCRSGNYGKYSVDCGPEPASIVPTSVVDVTHTKTIEFWKTQFSLSPRPTALAERHSPHKAVVLHNPWRPNLKVCADAEWENSGKDDAEVRIQKIKPSYNCAGKNPLYIDIGRPETTRSEYVYVTSSITHTVRPPRLRPTIITTTFVTTSEVFLPVTTTETIVNPTVVTTKTVFLPVTTTGVALPAPVTTESVTTESVTTESVTTESVTTMIVTLPAPVTTESVTTKTVFLPVTTTIVAPPAPVTTESVTTESVTTESVTTEFVTTMIVTLPAPVTTESVTTTTFAIFAPVITTTVASFATVNTTTSVLPSQR
ncbi:hypothetical protein P171DRAFT_470609 [Karstenula rhodostoma CBS 690.94]|uniref:Lytic polysaccharide monooxygenase n=1 Tax=Karstenula rhodostoma CBS 690.94 TaxID=1392251 RepID=A0A9P4PUF5_9PLEO|nr:hypothetical protein P171DRAFT_470609 [Karstenula rhodostoma CBS 690.94]